MEEIFTLPRICALVLAVVAAVIDYRTRKIPNVLTFSAPVAGLALQSWYYGEHSHLGHEAGMVAGAVSAIMGWIAGTGLMVATKLILKEFGHGDSKLMGALGSFIGPGEIILTYGFYSVSFGIFSFFWLWSTFPWAQLAVSMSAQRSGLPAVRLDLDRFNQARKTTVPVAPFIAIGLLTMMLFEKTALQFMGFN